MDSRKQLLKETVLFLLFSGLLIFAFSRISGNVRYDWQWYRVKRYLFTAAEGRITFGPLLRGLGVTLWISLISLFISFLIGTLTLLARLSEGIVASVIARLYVTLIRNTPLLIQLFFIYFVIAPVFNIPATPSAILALSLFEGAYTSEILRGAIFSIPKGQWEAAYSLGFSSGDLYCRIILPQALRTSLPALANQAINTVKDSALVSTIAIYDLTMRGREIISETFLTFEIWFTVAAIYLLITLGLQLCIHLIDRSLNSRQ
ncbi:amino acid ABC transporter permease [Sediminispirochaeta bajacaliforniensis]|uniref:amino acid ABC transporter permease n=1 Tax=Sediminispirochaeta bajacaliforniensis TaxID=148 RepID=UPI0003697152|nr:amino acid ABC transporter permease [Sediminispirochaeta bajacaliforniensis]